MNPYQEQGYKNRDDYLNSLSEEYGCPKQIVKLFAGMLGDDEDFDGLIAQLEDYTGDAADMY